MPTQVPPSRLDSSKDFSSLVPSAFAKANAAFEAANTASGAAATSTPKISSIVYPGNDTAAATAGGQTVTLNGAGFNAGASVLINGSYAGVVSVANSTSLSFTTPSNSGGTYILYVINTDGGTGISVPGISYSGTPSWSNAAGSLATVYETAAVNTQLTATGDIADGTITYSLQSGTLPPGSSLNSSTGLLSGTTQVTENSTTYNFTIRATDGQNQDTDRAFSITISPDVVTWSSPADGTVTALSQNEAMSNVTLSATSAAGQSVSYTANALPTGVTISGSNVTGTPTVLGNTISVITATAANTNRTATRTFTWVVSVANDTFFKNTTLLLNGETTVTPFINDASTNNFALTIAGDTKPVLFNPYTPGYYSNYFDGTGDYLSAPANAAFTFGTGDFTVESWVYYNNKTNSGIFQIGSSVFPGTNGIGCGLDASTNWLLYYGNGSQTAAGTGPTNGVWYHVATVRQSGVTKVYINGTQAISVTDTANYTGTYLGIAGIYSGSYVMNGYISNFRIVKGTALYTSTFTPSTTPLTAISGTSLLTCQSNRLIDNSTNNFTITKAGDVSVSSAIPFTANSSYSTYGSTYFDGTGDYLSASSSTAFAFGSGVDFTVEGWVYLTSYGPGTIAGGAIIGTTNGATAGWFVNVGQDINTLRITSNASGTWADNITVTSGNGIPLNTWTHIAFVRNGGSLVLYKNGVSVASMSGASAYNFTSPNNSAYMGYFSDGSVARNITGYISDVRVVKGTAVYTTAFTPPTAPLTAISGTSLLTLQYNGGATNQAIIDNGPFNNIITRTGNTSQGTFSPYSVTGWSNYFDGTGDYLSVSTGTIAIGTGDLTLECWGYRTSTTTLQSLVNINAYNTGILIRWETTKVTIYVGGTDYSYNTPTDIPLNSWVHIALVRSGGVFKFYVNGTQATTFNSSYSLSVTSVTIGTSSHDTSDEFYGYISNVRLVNSAIYTTTFTPSTTPLTAIAGTQLLTCQSNRFVDNSPNNFALTISGTPSVQAFSPFGSVPEAVPISYSYYFDGTGDYITGPSNTSLITTGQFTIECWVYTTSIGALRTIMENAHWDIGQTGGFRVKIKATTGHIELSASSGAYNTYPTVTTSTSGVAVNTWTHVALTRDSSNNISIFLNGNLVSTPVTYANSLSLSSDGNIGQLKVGMIISDGGIYEPYMGYISNLRVIQGTCLYTTTFTPPTSALTAVSGTSLLTCQSTRMIDNSTNNFTLTATGDVKPRIFNPFGYTAQSATSYTPSIHGGSAYFDGTGDYLSIPSNTVFAYGTGDYTAEAWVYLTSLNSYNGVIDFGSGGIRIVIFSNGTIEAGADGTTSWLTSSAGIFTINRWHHLALSRLNGTANIWLNGISVASGSRTGTVVATSGLIGKTNDNYHCIGYISDVRLVKGTAVYTSNFIPPAQSLTNYSTTNPASLLLNFNNGGIIDQHGTNVLETVGNTQLISEDPYGGSYYSNYFDGTGDYLTVPGTGITNIFTGDFTIEAWLFPTTAFSSAWVTNDGGFSDLPAMIVNASPSSLSYNWMFGPTSTGTVRFVTSSIYYEKVTSTEVCVVGKWNHLAVVKSGTSYTVYVNGVGSAPVTTITHPSYSDATGISIGANNGKYISGYLSNARIVAGTAVYTSNFTPSTTPLTSVSGTRLLTCQSSKFKDNSANALTVTVVGNTSVKSINPFQQNTGKSIYFDGTGDYLSIPTNQLMNFGTGDFTVEAWVYPNSLSTDWFIITASGSGGFFVGFSSTSTIGFGWGRTGTAWDYRVAGNATVSTWQHVAVTRSGTSMRLFVNGTQSGTTQTLSTAYDMSTTSTTVGSQGANYYLNGYIKDLRITKGYARYTSNFTPPTAALITK